MTEALSRPTVWATPGAVNPGAISVLRRMPPTSLDRSRTVTFAPAFAR